VVIVVEETEPGWSQVSLPDGTKGLVPRDYLVDHSEFDSLLSVRVLHAEGDAALDQGNDDALLDRHSHQLGKSPRRRVHREPARTGSDTVPVLCETDADIAHAQAEAQAEALTQAEALAPPSPASAPAPTPAPRAGRRGLWGWMRRGGSQRVRPARAPVASWSELSHRERVQFASLPWPKLEQQGLVTRAWCRVDKISFGGYGVDLNDFNMITQITNLKCTLKPNDTVIELDEVPLEGRRLCDALAEATPIGGIVLTVLRPAVSVPRLLRASAKLRRKSGSSAPSGSTRSAAVVPADADADELGVDADGRPMVDHTIPSSVQDLDCGGGVGGGGAGGEGGGRAGGEGCGEKSGELPVRVSSSLYVEVNDPSSPRGTGGESQSGSQSEGRKLDFTNTGQVTSRCSATTTTTAVSSPRLDELDSLEYASPRSWEAEQIEAFSWEAEQANTPAGLMC